MFFITYDCGNTAFGTPGHRVSYQTFNQDTLVHETVLFSTRELAEAELKTDKWLADGGDWKAQIEPYVPETVETVTPIETPVSETEVESAVPCFS